MKNLITLQAAYDFAANEQHSGKFVSLGAIQELVRSKPRNIKPTQGWHFTGDWKKSVAPVFHST